MFADYFNSHQSNSLETRHNACNDPEQIKAVAAQFLPHMIPADPKLTAWWLPNEYGQ